MSILKYSRAQPRPGHQPAWGCMQRPYCRENKQINTWCPCSEEMMPMLQNYAQWVTIYSSRGTLRVLCTYVHFTEHQLLCTCVCTLDGASARGCGTALSNDGNGPAQSIFHYLSPDMEYKNQSILALWEANNKGRLPQGDTYLMVPLYSSMCSLPHWATGHRLTLKACIVFLKSKLRLMPRWWLSRAR